MYLTPKEQELIAEMRYDRCSSVSQKTYSNRRCFYRAMWKLRDMGIAEIYVTIDGMNIWTLTRDGDVIAKVIRP